jgi:hypothetical protein
LSFCFAVRRDLDAAHLIGEAAVRRMDLDRRGLDVRESARKHRAQRILWGERRAILDHDLVEAGLASEPAFGQLLVGSV